MGAIFSICVSNDGGDMAIEMNYYKDHHGTIREFDSKIRYIVNLGHLSHDLFSSL